MLVTFFGEFNQLLFIINLAHVVIYISGIFFNAVEEALAHPYLARLHDIADEPVCTKPFSFEFETAHLGEEQIKDMIYQEALAFNPDCA